MNSIKWTQKHYLGKRKEDGTKVYILAPTWDCNWYWSFGYLNATGEHFHLRNYGDKNWKDCLERDYILNVKLRGDNLWKFIELAKTAYKLKEVAEILGRGGCQLTKNPLAELIKNQTEVNRINQIVLPQVFDAIDEIFAKN